MRFMFRHNWLQGWNNIVGYLPTNKVWWKNLLANNQPMFLVFVNISTIIFPWNGMWRVMWVSCSNNFLLIHLGCVGFVLEVICMTSRFHKSISDMENFLCFSWNFVCYFGVKTFSKCNNVLMSVSWTSVKNILV